MKGAGGEEGLLFDGNKRVCLWVGVYTYYTFSVEKRLFPKRKPAAPEQFVTLRLDFLQNFAGAVKSVLLVFDFKLRVRSLSPTSLTYHTKDYQAETRK